MNALTKPLKTRTVIRIFFWLAVLVAVAVLLITAAYNAEEAQYQSAKAALQMSDDLHRNVTEWTSRALRAGVPLNGTREGEREPDESMKPTTETSEAERQRRREAQQRDAQQIEVRRARPVRSEEMVSTPTPAHPRH